MLMAWRGSSGPEGVKRDYKKNLDYTKVYQKAYEYHESKLLSAEKTLASLNSSQGRATLQWSNLYTNNCFVIFQAFTCALNNRATKIIVGNYKGYLLRYIIAHTIFIIFKRKTKSRYFFQITMRAKPLQSIFKVKIIAFLLLKLNIILTY